MNHVPFMVAALCWGGYCALRCKSYAVGLTLTIVGGLALAFVDGLTGG